MTLPHNISGPTVRHELTRQGALIVELTAVDGPDIRCRSPAAALTPGLRSAAGA